MWYKLLIQVTLVDNLISQAEYPSLEEQQDMHIGTISGTTTWKDKIAEIKAKYPKSQVGVVTTVQELGGISFIPNK